MSFDGNDFSVIEVQNTLIAATAEFDRKVALGLDKWTIDECVEFANKIMNGPVLGELFKNQASKGPDIPTEFLFAKFSDFAAGFGLKKRFATTEGETALPLEFF